MLHSPTQCIDLYIPSDYLQKNWLHTVLHEVPWVNSSSISMSGFLHVHNIVGITYQVWQITVHACNIFSGTKRSLFDYHCDFCKSKNLRKQINKHIHDLCICLKACLVDISRNVANIYEDTKQKVPTNFILVC